jgi:hypothetical protein
MNVGDNAAGKTKINEGRILAVGAKNPSSHCLNRDGHFSQQVKKDGYIMRGKVPYGVHVFSDQAQVGSLGFHVINFSEDAVVQVFSYLADAWIEKKCMCNHQNPVFCRCKSDQVLGFPDVDC